jgi:Xaa-Pro aminopeptidase
MNEAVNMFEARVERARKLVTTAGVDAVLVFGVTSMRYLAGFTGSDGVLAVAGDGQWLLCDGRYTTQASQEAASWQIAEYRRKLDGITELVARQGWHRVGFDADHIPHAFYRALAEALQGQELVPLEGGLDELRSIKSAEEILLITETCVLASRAFEALFPMIRPGARERDLALELEILMKRAGADEKAFDFIVASGERGALPHGKASDRYLEAGDLVTFDFGARYHGYHSDETVTVAVGRVTERQQEVHRVVLEAHDQAIQAVRPGVSCRELDGIARSHIESHGYGGWFGHGLGHGIGLEIHESPTLSSRSDHVVQEGMVFTVEPGVYIPGWGGVRIEDTVEVTAAGCRVLTQVPKTLRIAG